VPATVIQRGPNGLYAYIVNEDESVAMQPVKVAYSQDGKTVIENGLSGGTRVVVDGQYKLKPGTKITEFQAPAAKTRPPAQGASRSESSTSEKK
jgi:multidrug efflux system membrane fusion protein